MKADMALLCGILFGVGLSLADMINPNKIQNFLDITGQFDPSLLLVMLAALPVGFISFQLILIRKKPILSDSFQVSSKKNIDKQLIIGALIFGCGWGLTGYCPGPAITGLALLSVEPLIVVISILAGFIFYHYVFNKEN